MKNQITKFDVYEWDCDFDDDFCTIEDAIAHEREVGGVRETLLKSFDIAEDAVAFAKTLTPTTNFLHDGRLEATFYTVEENIYNVADDGSLDIDCCEELIAEFLAPIPEEIK